jgi:hypothetical protein
MNKRGIQYWGQSSDRCARTCMINVEGGLEGTVRSLDIWEVSYDVVCSGHLRWNSKRQIRWNSKKQILYWHTCGLMTNLESWQQLLCHPQGKCVSTQVFCGFWVDQICDCLLRQTTTSETKRSRPRMSTSINEISCVDIGGPIVSPSVSWHGCRWIDQM